MGNVIFKDFRAPQFNERGRQDIKNAAIRNGYDLDQADEERTLLTERDHFDLTLVERDLLSRIEGLWLLCHPDRHPGNEQMALEMCYWLQSVQVQMEDEKDPPDMEGGCPF